MEEVVTLTHHPSRWEGRRTERFDVAHRYLKPRLLEEFTSRTASKAFGGTLILLDEPRRNLPKRT
jgi:hypothetical protein